MNLMKFAFRNVLRNKKRSILTAASIFFASIIVTIGIGFFNGLIDSVCKNYIDYSMGNFKVTTTGFVRYERFMPMDEYIRESGRLTSEIEKLPGVSSVEERVRFGIILGKGENSETAMGIGVNLKSNKLDLEKKLMNGKLEDEGLYVCIGLAEKLNISKGDDILLATSTTERGLNGIKLKVKGIINFGINMFDKRYFFMDLQNARRLLKMENGITEIYVFTDKKARLPIVRNEIQKILPAGLVVRDPGQQTGGFYDLLQNALYFYYFILMLILMLASFVIVNTMVMTVFERMREIGTMKALGFTDGEIFLNFIFEGTIIGGIGGIAGGLIGYLLTIFYSIKGIDFSAQKSREMPFNFMIYPSIDIQVLIIAVVMAVVISTAAAVIPAQRARKLSPAEALRQI